MKNYPLKKEQVLTELRRRLRTKEISPGSKLKRGIDLAKEFNVSHITIRSVLKELSLSGELQVIHGKGTFAPLENNYRLSPNILIIKYSETAEKPINYIIPSFIARLNELGGKATEINIQFIKNNPSESMITVLRNSGYTGILLDGNHYIGNEIELKILRKLDIPILLPHALSKDVNITGFTALGCNIKQAWKDGLAAIVNSGRKRIALLLCDYPRTLLGEGTLFRERTIDEHLNLLRNNGACDDPNLIQICPHVSSTNSDKEIFNSLDKLFALKNKPDAIYCFSDFLALKVYNYLHAKNITIPNDIAVMGFCGYPGGSLLNPPLATIDEDYSSHGKIAAEMLCSTEKWYKKDKKPQWIEIPYKICIRGSMGKR